MRYLILALAAISLWISPATAKTLSRIVAVVNNDIITSYQLDQAVQENLKLMTNQNQLTATQFDELKKQTMDKLITDMLMNQKIKELGLEVSDAELSAAIGDVQRKNNLSDDALVDALAAQGMTMASYRDKISKEILHYKLMGREVNRKVLVTSGEIRDYFRDHIDEYRVPPTIHVRHIAYPVPKQATDQDLAVLHKQIEAARQRLLAGDDFATVVASQQEIADGADMGEMKETDLAPQLSKLFAGLKKGDVSEPVMMNGDLHLFQVVDRNPGDVHLFDRVKSKIEQLLREQKTEARYQEWVKDIRKSAHIDIRM